MKKHQMLIVCLLLTISLKSQIVEVTTFEDVAKMFSIINENPVLIEKNKSITDTAYLADIPVVVHIIHNGEPYGVGANIPDENIHQLIREINYYYRLLGDPFYVNNPYLGNLDRGGLDTKVQFHLADIDTNCNYTTGIYRVNGSSVTDYLTSGCINNTVNPNVIEIKSLSKFDTEKYLNIWVVSTITPSSICGFASLAPSFGYEYFGIVLRADNLYNCHTHEIGHTLGLSHTDMQVGGLTRESSYIIIRNSINNYLSQLLDTVVCTPPLSNDLRLVTVGEKLKGSRCEKSYPVQVVVKNMGSSTISTFTVKIMSGSNTLTSYIWNGALYTHQTDTVDIPPFNILAGEYNITVFIENPNNLSDQNKINDTIRTALNVIPYINSTGLPYVQDFEGSNYSDEISMISDTNCFWSIIQGYGTGGSKGLVIQGSSNIINYPNPGYFINCGGNNAHIINPTYITNVSTCIDASSLSLFSMSYDYFKKNFYNSTCHLTVWVNNDHVTQSYWINSELIKSGRDTVDLSNYAGTDDVLISFIAVMKYNKDYNGLNNGDYIVLDDIRIHSSQPQPVVAGIELIPRFGCPMLTSVVNDKTGGVPAPVDYVWIFEGANVNGAPEFHGKLIPELLVYNNNGYYDVTVVVKDALGFKDSITYVDYVVVGPRLMVEIKEDFETLCNWTIGKFGTGFNSLVVTNNAGGYGLSSKSLLYEGISMYPNQTCLSTYRNTYTSFPYDFTYYTNTYLKFDLSYAPQTIAASDTLIVEYSTNCGTTWTPVYKKWGSYLATINEADYPGSSSLFVPVSASQWRTDSINLSVLNGAPSVILRFVIIACHGNALYMDNIQVYYTYSSVEIGEQIANTTSRSFVTSVYPNPATDRIKVEVEQNKIQTVEVKLLDITGKIIREIQKSNAKDIKYSIDVEGIEPGLYFLKIIAGNEEKTYKIVLGK